MAPPHPERNPTPSCCGKNRLSCEGLSFFIQILAMILRSVRPIAIGRTPPSGLDSPISLAP